MKIALLLALFTVGECGVVSHTGQNVTLDCKYDINYHKERSICWNRGDISTSGCNNQLVATGSYKTAADTNSRYQLLGRLDEGDVSLTILNVTEADGGRYGCRVDISGWFNDEKHHIDLTVDGAPQTTAPTDRNTSAQPPAASRTPDPMTSTENLSTSPGGSLSSPEVQQHSSSSIVVLLFIFFWLVAVITTGAIIVVVRRCRQVNKIPQVNNTVQFNSTASTLHLQSRASVEENVYQIDGNEYEYVRQA